jgi:putative nucleotidyltransferase with HDIG domain
MNGHQLAGKAKDAARKGGPASLARLGLETKGLGFQAGLWGAVTLLAVLMAHPAPTEYQVDQVSDHTIRADHSFLFLDQAATQRKRLEAENQVPQVFILDDLQVIILEKQAIQLFQRARALMESGGDDREEIKDLEFAFSRLFGLSADSGIWAGLLERSFDQALEKQALGIALDIMFNGFMEEIPDTHTGSSSAVSIVQLSTRSEYIKPRLEALTDRRELDRFLDIQGRLLAMEYGQEGTDIILALVRGLVRPNIELDTQKTHERFKQAASEAQDIYVEIRPGQIIVQEGTIIDQDAMEKIRVMRLGRESNEGHWLKRFAGLFLALFLFYNLKLILFSLSRQRRLRLMPPREQVFMGLIIILAAMAAHTALLFGTALSWDFDYVDNNTLFLSLPLPAAAMLAGVFFGLRRATLAIVLVAVTTAVIIPGEFRLMAVLYMVNGSLAAVLSLRNMKERKALVPASLCVMAVNCLTLLSLTLVIDSGWGYQTVNNFLAAAACGFFSGILTSGFIPLVEMTFGFNTNLKMLELGNLDHPILRELMLTAPGTYHHSVIVGAMVEAAAESIGANPYVAKVGAYYHDIGKMKKPLYFVENQSGENRHDTLAPSMSALVLVGHVREGLEMAKGGQLPQVIIDIIEQHHGVSLMGFFYHKAKEQYLPGQPEINEGDFRYPGPKPRSAEAGLVMLGDICEAATRSLSEHTPQKIRNLVKAMANHVFSDGQLDECDLKTSDIAVVVNVFTTILIGIYHRRVAYPRKPDTAPAASSSEGRKTRGPAYDHLFVEPPKDTAH